MLSHDVSPFNYVEPSGKHGKSCSSAEIQPNKFSYTFDFWKTAYYFINKPFQEISSLISTLTIEVNQSNKDNSWQTLLHNM